MLFSYRNFSDSQLLHCLHYKLDCDSVIYVMFLEVHCDILPKWAFHLNAETMSFAQVGPFFCWTWNALSGFFGFCARFRSDNFRSELALHCFCFLWVLLSKPTFPCLRLLNVRFSLRQSYFFRSLISDSISMAVRSIFTCVACDNRFRLLLRISCSCC